MLKGFKDFIFKGNVVDLGVAVIIASAFGGIVNSFVKDLVTPLIGAFGGIPDFSGILFTINKSKFLIGDLINSVISFLIISSIIYFLIILPMNKIQERIKKDKTVDPIEKICPECLSSIPIKARKCKYCSSVVGK